MAYFLWLDHGVQIPLHNQDSDDEELIILEAVARCEAAMFGGALFEGELGQTCRVFGVVQFSGSFEAYMEFVPRGNAS